MTLADLITAAREVAPRDPTGRLQMDWQIWRRFINRRYRQVLSKSRWSFLQKTATFSTTAQYKTGTITTTAGSTSVTGTGTSWTASMVGSYLTVPGNPFLRITAVGSPTSLTVESAYPVSLTSAAYNIVTPVYALNSDIWYPIQFTAQWPLFGPYPWRTFDRIDPYRQNTGAPFAYSMFGRDVVGFAATPSALPALQVELYPSPDLVYVVRYRYAYNVPDLNAGTDVPVFINPQLLIYGAVAESFNYFAAVMGQPQLASGGQAWDNMFKEMLEDMEERDRPNQNIPRTQGTNPPGVNYNQLAQLGSPMNVFSPTGVGFEPAV